MRAHRLRKNYSRNFSSIRSTPKSSGLVVQFKLKCLLMKPTHDDIIEAKDVYIQLSFKRYDGKLVLVI